MLLMNMVAFTTAFLHSTVPYPIILGLPHNSCLNSVVFIKYKKVMNLDISHAAFLYVPQSLACYR